MASRAWNHRPGQREGVSDAVREEVFRRDGYACQACGATNLQLQADHIVPRNEGGSDEVSNLRTLCKPCNSSRQDDLPGVLSPAWRRPAGGRVHNSPGALGVKVALRRKALEHVNPARVLDCFCGPDGVMWSLVWRGGAATYAGIDQAFVLEREKRSRWVGDTHKILRAIDLQAWNVFDVDAFEDPWRAAVIIAARRRWAKGERGAILVTTSTLKIRFGIPRGLQELVGVSFKAPTASDAGAMTRTALLRWAERSRVDVTGAWVEEMSSRARGAPSSVAMIYGAITFEGR